jgi:hypothetical protein
MKTRTSLLALTLITAGTCAMAEGPLGSSFSSTDAATSADVAQHDTRVMGSGPAKWSGKVSRADVIADMLEARRTGMLPAGEAIGYPYPYKTSQPLAAGVSPQTGTTEVLGGPPRDGINPDGYRFVGGEAGYELVDPSLRRR